MKLEKRLRKLGEAERRRVLAALRRLLERDERVVFAYVFGGFVERVVTRDVDVAVWLAEGVDPLGYVLEAGVELEEAASMPVDVVVLNEAPEALRYTVFTRGAPLIVKDRVLHDAVVAASILGYADLLMLRRVSRGTR